MPWEGPVSSTISETTTDPSCLFPKSKPAMFVPAKETLGGGGM